MKDEKFEIKVRARARAKEKDLLQELENLRRCR